MATKHPRGNPTRMAAAIYPQLVPHELRSLRALLPDEKSYT
jgi:hypothetical protein